MDAFVQREQPAHPAAAPKDPFEEMDEARKLEGFMFSDQLHARMPCKYDGSHIPFIFRAKSGVNINKLWWKCPNCIDQKSKKPGKLIALDSELEESGKRRAEELQEGDDTTQPAVRAKSARKDVQVPAGAIVASGRGLDFAALIDDVRAIRAIVERLEANAGKHDRTDGEGS
jgi:hypothetical protein